VHSKKKWSSIMAEEVVVIEKVIAKEPLTKEMIEAGANVLRHLNKANLDVRAALWIYRLESNSWRLVFALPEVEKDGPLKSYTKIRRILSQIPDNQPRLTLSDIKVSETNHGLITALRKRNNLANKEFPQHVYHVGGNDHHVDEGYIYQL
jgi:hypothetical protein